MRHGAQPLTVNPGLTKEQKEEAHFLSNPNFADLIKAVSEGCSIKHAANLSGFEESRIYAMLSEENSTFKPALLRLIKRAQATNYKRHIDKVQRSQDWRSSSWWLEAKEEEFKRAAHQGATNTVNVAVMNGKPSEISLGPEQLNRLSAAYDAEMNQNGPKKPSKPQAAIIPLPNDQNGSQTP